MPSTAILYTDSDTVRALAGLTANEVTDPALLSMQLEKALSVDLIRWVPTHADIKTAGMASGAVAGAVLQWDLLQLYASHFCAVRLLQSPMHIPLQKGNGKDTAKRFDETILLQSVTDLSRSRDEYRDQLLELIEAPAAITDTGLFKRAVPISDPVTGV